MTDYALRLSDDEVQRYLAMARHARDAEAEQWALAGITAGARVADVGCGPGATLVTMAEVVGPAGGVDGVDGDPVAVERAVQMIAESGHTHATARVGNADETGFEPGAYDVAVMRHVLAHNGGREQAIVDHLASLVRPGGCVYLVDAELTAIRTRHQPADLDDLSRRYVEYQASRGNDMQIGLRLGELLAAAGLDVVDHRGWYTIVTIPPGLRGPSWAARDAMRAAGFATDEDIARWDRAATQADRAEQRPVIFMPTFTAIGRRP